MKLLPCAEDARLPDHAGLISQHQSALSPKKARPILQDSLRAELEQAATLHFQQHCQFPISPSNVQALTGYCSLSRASVT